MMYTATGTHCHDSTIFLPYRYRPNQSLWGYITMTRWWGGIAPICVASAWCMLNATIFDTRFDSFCSGFDRDDDTRAPPGCLEKEGKAFFAGRAGSFLSAQVANVKYLRQRSGTASPNTGRLSHKLYPLPKLRFSWDGTHPPRSETTIFEPNPPTNYTTVLEAPSLQFTATNKQRKKTTPIP